MFHCVIIKRLRGKLNYLEHSTDVDVHNEGKKTRKPVTDGVRSKKKKEEQEVQNTQTLKYRGKDCKKNIWKFQEYEKYRQLTGFKKLIEERPYFISVICH